MADRLPCPWTLRSQPRTAGPPRIAEAADQSARIRCPPKVIEPDQAPPLLTWVTAPVPPVVRSEIPRC